MKSIITKGLIFSLALILNSCSVAMYNIDSPMRLNKCHYWPMIVDGILAAGSVAALGVVDRSNVVSDAERPIYVTSLSISSGLFGLATIAGTGDYLKCKEQ